MVKLQRQRAQQGEDGHYRDEPLDIMQHPAQGVVDYAVPVHGLVNLGLNFRIVGMGNLFAHKYAS